MKSQKYKCCLCKRSGGWEFSYFHHFTPKMKERYQCIRCRFGDQKAIGWARAEHAKFTKQMRFLNKLTGPNGAKFAREYLKKLETSKV